MAARDAQRRRSEEEEGEAQSCAACFSRCQHGISSEFNERPCRCRLAFLQEQAFDFTNRIRFKQRIAAKGTDVGGDVVDNDDLALVADGMHSCGFFVLSGTSFNAAVHSDYLS